MSISPSRCVAPITVPATGVPEQIVALTDAVQRLTAAIQQITAGASALTSGAAAAPQLTPSAPTQTAQTAQTTQTARSPRTAQTGPVRDAAAGASFTISSYNVLGHSHTAPGGNYRGYASSSQRIAGVVKQLRDHDVEVVGLQEFQKPQQQDFRKLASEYDTVGTNDPVNDNVIAWRKDRFKLVAQRSVTIPYLGGGQRKMPIAKLQDLTTGKQMWVINVHNPAFKEHTGLRRKAEQIERQVIEDLKADGTPVFIVGDFNDQAPAKQAMERGGLMRAATAAHGSAGVDWIFGSPNVQMSKATYDMSQRTKTSDHPMVVAEARV